MSLDIIKETEETAWLMGCSEKEIRLQRQNLGKNLKLFLAPTNIRFKMGNNGLVVAVAKFSDSSDISCMFF